MEKPPQRNENNIVFDIKNKLLKGEISFLEFKNQLLELDQSTPDRINAIKVLDILYDKDVVELINKNEEIIEHYESFLSFIEFHVAQIKLNKKEKDYTQNLENALRFAQNEPWENYVLGTIIYLEGKIIPEDVLEKSKGLGKNYSILQRFNDRLIKRGYPDYFTDYNNLPLQNNV